MAVFGKDRLRVILHAFQRQLPVAHRFEHLDQTRGARREEERAVAIGVSEEASHGRYGETADVPEPGVEGESSAATGHLAATVQHQKGDEDKRHAEHSV